MQEGEKVVRTSHELLLNIFTALIMFSTDWCPELMGGLYCHVFQIKKSDDMADKYADVLVFRLPMILVIIFIVLLLLPSQSDSQDN